MLKTLLSTALLAGLAVSAAAQEMTWRKMCNR